MATDTNFFRAANEMEFKKPFPVQQPQVVARKMVAGIEHGKDRVSPCPLFGMSQQLMKFAPFVRSVYWAMEKKKFDEFRTRLNK